MSDRKDREDAYRDLVKIEGETFSSVEEAQKKWADYSCWHKEIIKKTLSKVIKQRKPDVLGRVPIDEIVDKYCNESTSEEVVALMYRIFEELSFIYPDGLKIED